MKIRLSSACEMLALKVHSSFTNIAVKVSIILFVKKKKRNVTSTSEKIIQGKRMKPVE
jgi:hypothetical protein